MSRYTIAVDGKILYAPESKDFTVTSAALSMTAGEAGFLDLTIPKMNPLYDQLKLRNSMVSVFRDGKEIFYGELRSIDSVDWLNNKSCHFVGALAFLDDSIQPPKEYHNITVAALLEDVLLRHNTGMDARKKISLGVVNVGVGENLYRMANDDLSLSFINDRLADRLGGYFSVRHENGNLYLDYQDLQTSGVLSEQAVEFGQNLIDYLREETTDDIITEILPRGAIIEDEEVIQDVQKRVDIKTVNDGAETLVNAAAAAKFGRIRRVVTWDDVTEPAHLKAKAEAYLTAAQWETKTYTVDALDLGATEAMPFNIGDRVSIKAKPYGVDMILPVAAMKIDLLEPGRTQVTFSTASKPSLGGLSSQIAAGNSELREEIRSANANVQAAINQVAQVVGRDNPGYKLSEYDTDGRWLRDLYMDSPSKEDAQEILVVTRSGIGATQNGYDGPYDLGLLSNGTINGHWISADSIDVTQLTQSCTTSIVGNATSIADEHMTEALKGYASWTDIETRLQTTADSITAGVYSSIKVGGSNMLIGTKDMSKWTTMYPDTNTDDGKRVTGQLNGFTVKKFSSTASSYQRMCAQYDKVTLEPGTTYCFSFWAQGSTVGADRLGLYLLTSESGGVLKEENYECISELAYSYMKPEYISSIYYIPVTSSWRRYTIRIKTPAWTSGSGLYTVYFGAKGTVWYGKLMLEKASIPSDWSPHPNDYEETFATKSELTVTADGIRSAVSQKVGSSEVTSLIEQKADSIRLKAGKISWSSTYSSMTESGKLTCSDAEASGTFKAGSNSGYWVQLAGSGKLTGGYGSSQYGYIDYSASVYDVDNPSRTWNGIQIQGGCLRISTDIITVMNTTNTGTTTIQGYTGYINDVATDMDSTLSSCNRRDLRFINGLLVSA